MKKRKSQSDSGPSKPVPQFLLKTFKMVEDPNTDKCVAWTDKGDAFVVKNEHEFAAKVLPVYFRHQNFSSFVRQLNFYGFKKQSKKSGVSRFVHPLFRRGEEDKLANIKRKSSEATSIKDTVDDLQTQVLQLQKQYEDIWQVQRQILYILSKFVGRDTNSITSSRTLKRPRISTAPPPRTGRRNLRLLEAGPSSDSYIQGPVASHSSEPLSPGFGLGLGSSSPTLPSPSSFARTTPAPVASSSMDPGTPVLGPSSSKYSNEDTLRQLEQIRSVVDSLPSMDQQQMLGNVQSLMANAGPLPGLSPIELGRHHSFSDLLQQQQHQSHGNPDDLVVSNIQTSFPPVSPSAHANIELLPDESPGSSAHGTPLAFLDPADPLEPDFNLGAPIGSSFGSDDPLGTGSPNPFQ